MNRLFILALLCIGTLGASAQQSCKNFDNSSLKNNGKPVPVAPDCLSRPYTVVDDSKPACYIYKKHGLVVMECPGIEVAPEIDYTAQGTYTGYYPGRDAAKNNQQQNTENNTDNKDK